MNQWLAAAAVLEIALTGCTLSSLRRGPLHGVMALELGTVFQVLALLLFGQGFGRAPYLGLALVLAVTALPGSLMFLRHLERWEG